MDYATLPLFLSLLCPWQTLGPASATDARAHGIAGSPVFPFFLFLFADPYEEKGSFQGFFFSYNRHGIGGRGCREVMPSVRFRFSFPFFFLPVPTQAFKLELTDGKTRSASFSFFLLFHPANGDVQPDGSSATRKK